jgi:threonine dehydratase
LEITEQALDLNLHLDALLCPCGGGGLIAGTALAVKPCQASSEDEYQRGD